MKFRQLFAVLIGLSSSVLATEMTAVKKVQMETQVVLDGHVEAISESTVSSQVNATVKYIHVDVDDQVPAGKLLIELDDTELKARLEKANAALQVARAQSKQASSEYERLNRLAQESFVSENDMTRASSAVSVANANINLAKAQIAEVSQMLTYTKIIAPYAGVVTARHIEVGETANFGQPLLTGFALNQNRLTVQVPNSLIDAVENNKSLLVKNQNQQWVELTNLTISPSANVNTHTVMVRANINKGEFNQRPGSFISVAVKVDPRESLVIPASALVAQGDLTAVYVQSGERVVLRQVVVGESGPGLIEVLSGLKQGEHVVVNGSAFLAKSN